MALSRKMAARLRGGGSRASVLRRCGRLNQPLGIRWGCLNPRFLSPRSSNQPQRHFLSRTKNGGTRRRILPFWRQAGIFEAWAGLRVVARERIPMRVGVLLLLAAASFAVAGGASEQGGKEGGKAVKDGGGGKKSVALLGIGVVTRAGTFERRQLLREVLGGYRSFKDGKTRLGFFIAKPKDAKEEGKVREESDKYGDVHVVEVAEGYHNIPGQTLGMLKHFADDEPVKFILKTDDDVMVRVDMLAEWLEALAKDAGSSRVQAGWNVHGANVHRNGKWAVSKDEYEGDVWPRYASGPAYVLSRSLARRILALGDSRSRLHLEDVAMGLWVAQVKNSTKVRVVEERRFWKTRVCEEWSFTVLLETGRPLNYEEADVSSAMRAIASADQGGGGSEDGVCPVGSRLSDVKSRIECQKGKRAGSAEWYACSPWLEASKAVAGGAKHSYGKALFNLYPGGSEQIQLSAEGAVVSECEKARGEWLDGGWDDQGLRWRDGEEYGLSRRGGGGGEAGIWGAGRSQRVRVLVHDDMNDYHPFLSPPDTEGGIVRHCPVPCVFRGLGGDAGLVGTDVDVDEAHVVLFLGDLELYRADPGGRSGLPGKRRQGGGAVRAVAVREALSKFPAKAWEKYDANVTYERGSDAAYGYVASVDALLRSSAASPSWGQRENSMSAVTLRCGSGKAKEDGRARRTKFIKDMNKSEFKVRSYGACANNAQWPDGHFKDKAHVTRMSRFCLAYENSEDKDYVTEKLFDCLAGGAVPVAWGGHHVREFAPPNSTLFVDDYESVEALAKEMAAIGGDEARWESMRAWVVEREGQEYERWEAVMREVEGAGARCRVCELGGWQGRRMEVDDGKRRRRYAWEADRVEKEETMKRIGKADPKLVKIEL